ncbi:hypothetical protein [Humidesulfovibrio mexicanus]|uniref:hypothetical protein n=1 Tax=Humidesulfovibrio mexicanus TaxID=147047 RepID=UPI0015C68B86|nr:hypothetical protein [Humidesulfovibrio mexicanus]
MKTNTKLRCQSILCMLYSLYCSSGWPRVDLFESISKCIPDVDRLTADDYMNWNEISAKFHSDACASILGNIYDQTRLVMSQTEYEQSGKVFECIEFILNMAANASSHGLTVTDRLEMDWREYDRLDVPEERLRYYNNVLAEFKEQ